MLIQKVVAVIFLGDVILGACPYCQNSGSCVNDGTQDICLCVDGFYGDSCENVGYVYTFTRVISAGSDLLTSSGAIITDVTMETGIRFETTYTKSLIIQNTASVAPSSEYDCVCTRYGNASEETTADQQELVDKIQEELLLDRDQLARTIMRYKTREDDRPSARSIGTVGILCIVMTAVLIVVPDLFELLRCMPPKKPPKIVKKSTKVKYEKQS